MGYIAIEVDGKVEVHAAGHPTGNYDTLCGMEADDPGINHRPAGVIIGARINCADCIQIIRDAKKYCERDFEQQLRK